MPLCTVKSKIGNFSHLNGLIVDRELSQISEVQMDIFV